MTEMTTFTSVTSWQCDPEWNIEIKVPGFRTAKDAALFGNGQCPYSIKQLAMEGEKLIIRMSAGQDLIVNDSNVVVSRMKDDSRGKSIWDMDDFVVVDIKPAQFQSEPGLSKSFVSLSYGVRDHLGNPVEVRMDAHDLRRPEFNLAKRSETAISQ